MAKFSLEDLTPMVEGASKEFGVPSDYIWNVIRAENSGSPRGAQKLSAVHDNLTSSANAKGIMQVTPVALQDVIQSGLIPSTVKHDQMTPQDQIRVGTAYLSKLLKLSDKPDEVYAMYNYGPKARFRMADLPQETQGYLAKTGSAGTPASSSGATIGAKTVTKTETATGGGGTGTFGGGSLNSEQLVQSLLQNMTSQNAAMDRAASRATTGFELGAESQQQAIAQQRQAVDSAAALAAQKAQTQFVQNRALEDLQRTFGLDQSQVDNEIAKSLAVAQTARDSRVAVRAEYDELASKDMLTNPIGYMLAQLKMPAVAARNNALADAEDLALQNIDKRTQQFTAAKSVLSANTADQILDQQLKQAQIEAQVADAKLRQEEGKVQVASASAAMQQALLENQKGDNVRNTLNTILSLEDREEARRQRKEQRDELLAGKKLKEEEDLRMNARLKIVSDSLGLVEPMTVQRLKGLTNKKTQEAWAGVALSGQYGDNLESSLAFYLSNGVRDRIQTAGNASMYGTANKLAQAAGSLEMQASRELAAANQGKTPKKEDTVSKSYEIYRDSVVNSTAGVSYPTDLASSQWDRTFNPYVAPFLSFNKTINEQPKLKLLENNLVKVAIDNLAKSGAIKTENLSAEQQQQVILSIADQVSQGKVDPKRAAAEVSQYFRAAAAYNSQLNKYELFGLPNQRSYLFTLQGSFGDMNTRKMDLMNPADVENSLVWRAKQQQVTTYGSSSVFFR